MRKDSPLRSIGDVDRDGIKVAVGDKVDGNFMIIGQASGIPKGRPHAARYLREFIEEAKASGFVARALRESGIADATVAPAAPATARAGY